MPCYHPMLVYRSTCANESGKRPVSFSPNGAFSDLRIQLPCGRCIGCRLERARRWAVRCMNELREHEEAAFITLTYDDANLPFDGQLVPNDLTLFIKRLRKAVYPVKIRYMACGEYGTEKKRPHYHIILFGYEFKKDRERLVTDPKKTEYISAQLRRLWGMGIASFGTVTFESAAYVAGYIIDKQLGKGVDPDRVQPFLRMSRRPGIGMRYFEKYADEIYNTDSIIIRGRECRPPRAYDDKYREMNPKKWKTVAAKREAKAKNKSVSLERLQGKELCALKNKKRRNKNG